MKIFVLDDSKDRIKEFAARLAGHDVCFAENAQAAIQCLQETQYDLIFLDHDLGEEATGKTVAKWLADHGVKHDTIVIIHSTNPIGSQEMYNILWEANIGAVKLPYIWTASSFARHLRLPGV